MSEPAAGRPPSIVTDILAMLAQGVAFFVGLCLSLIIGMVVAKHFEGPAGLLVATLVAGVGLLGAASLSQAFRDSLLMRAGGR